MGHQFEQLSKSLIGAAIAVHRELSVPASWNPLTKCALKTALRHRGIVYEAQKEIAVIFEGEEAGVQRLDLLVEKQIIVEFKAVKTLEDIHFAQLLVPEGHASACRTVDEFQRGNADRQAGRAGLQGAGIRSGRMIR